VSQALDPLVSTKLRPSRSRPGLVARPRLSEGLDPDAGRRLTLVSAPAGFGKSTLLGKWAEERAGGGCPVAWLSLDAGDNDPTRFLSYLVAAIERIVEEEGFGEGVLAALRSPEPSRIEALMTALVNEISALPGELDLVLDDYHLIDSESVHKIVSYLLERLPDGAHLVLSSRADPPLPLARLRARGQMAELGAADLAFTEEEADSFLKGVMDLDSSAEDVAKLEGRTEGWIAGLQLAALSMRGREDASGFVETFSGSNRDVLDFLAEEVLEIQPEAVRGFLLATSVLERLSAPLCDTLTGNNDGDEMLKRLERENVFVVALDDERRWYRYHHLFAEFLRGRLVHESPGLAGELHLRASAWYEDNGLISEAIGHAFSAPDYERAARLIEKGIPAALRRGEFPTVLRWLEGLPTEAKRLRPRLLTRHAVALTLTGRPDDVEPLLGEAENIAETTAKQDRRFLLGYAAAVRSWRARLRGDAPRAVEHARRALSLLPDEDVDQRSFAASGLGFALRITGDLAAADEALAEALKIARAADHTYGTLSTMVWRARLQMELGRLRQAEDSFGRALRFVAERGVGLLPAAGIAHIGIGALLYERDELEEAERELEKGIGLAERAGEVGNLVWGYVTLSQTRRARGDEKGALEMAREAERVARGSGADLQLAIAVAWMTRLRLARGDLGGAAGQERAAGADGAAGIAGVARFAHLLTSARLLRAEGRHREALGLLEELREETEASGRTGDLIDVLTLQALALWEGSKRVRAVGTLAEAMELAEPEGYVRTFVDEGPPMADILSGMLEAQQRGSLDPPVPARYLSKLFVVLERDTARPVSPVGGLLEHLSGREHEILQLVAAGKSNRRIAQELYVSVGTVKTHLNNLYRKLGVRSRTQAVARARELKLI
jgi:LuxR family transcriptional regulator, maltose regulon positive regulatory protein